MEKAKSLIIGDPESFKDAGDIVETIMAILLPKALEIFRREI